MVFDNFKHSNLLNNNLIKKYDNDVSDSNEEEKNKIENNKVTGKIPSLNREKSVADLIHQFEERTHKESVVLSPSKQKKLSLKTPIADGSQSTNSSIGKFFKNRLSSKELYSSSSSNYEPSHSHPHATLLTKDLIFLTHPDYSTDFSLPDSEPLTYAEMSGFFTERVDAQDLREADFYNSESESLPDILNPYYTREEKEEPKVFKPHVYKDAPLSSQKSRGMISKRDLEKEQSIETNPDKIHENMIMIFKTLQVEHLNDDFKFGKNGVVNQFLIYEACQSKKTARNYVLTGEGSENLFPRYGMILLEALDFLKEHVLLCFPENSSFLWNEERNRNHVKKLEGVDKKKVKKWLSTFKIKKQFPKKHSKKIKERVRSYSVGAFHLKTTSKIPLLSSHSLDSAEKNSSSKALERLDKKLEDLNQKVETKRWLNLLLESEVLLIHKQKILEGLYTINIANPLEIKKGFWIDGLVLNIYTRIQELPGNHSVTALFSNMIKEIRTYIECIYFEKFLDPYMRGVKRQILESPYLKNQLFSLSSIKEKLKQMFLEGTFTLEKKTISMNLEDLPRALKDPTIHFYQEERELFFCENSSHEEMSANNKAKVLGEMLDAFSHCFLDNREIFRYLAFAILNKSLNPDLNLTYEEIEILFTKLKTLEFNEKTEIGLRMQKYSLVGIDLERAIRYLKMSFNFGWQNILYSINTSLMSNRMKAFNHSKLNFEGRVRNEIEEKNRINVYFHNGVCEIRYFRKDRVCGNAYLQQVCSVKIHTQNTQETFDEHSFKIEHVKLGFDPSLYVQNAALQELKIELEVLLSQWDMKLEIIHLEEHRNNGKNNTNV